MRGKPSAQAVSHSQGLWHDGPHGALKGESSLRKTPDLGHLFDMLGEGQGCCTMLLLPTALRCAMTVRHTASASARLLMHLALREPLLKLLLLLHLQLLQLVYLLHGERRRGVLLVLHTLSAP